MIEKLDRIKINDTLIMWRALRDSGTYHPPLLQTTYQPAVTISYTDFTEIDVVLEKLNELIAKVNELEKIVKG